MKLRFRGGGKIRRHLRNKLVVIIDCKESRSCNSPVASRVLAG